MIYVNHGNVKVQKWHFKILLYFLYLFFIHIKMSENLSAKCYQENNERLQKKKARERYQNFSEKEKEKKR